MTRRGSAAFAPAVGLSALIVLGAPYLGALRGAMLAWFPEYYVAIMWGAVLGGGALLVTACVASIRDRHLPRYAALCAALGFGALCEWWLRTGDTNVDAVEAFHFVEYAAVTWAFYRVWRPRADLSSLVFPASSAITVGVCDEWLQWFVPLRAGELRDVAMDGLAVVCGLSFSLAIDPPEAMRLRGRPGSWVRMGAGTAAVVGLSALFLMSVHLGHTVSEPVAGRFASRYTASELDAASRVRADRWLRAPPVAVARFSREDQYLSEGLSHVRWRNRAMDDGDLATAWHEHLILERFFAPVLEHPSYAAPDGARWTAEMRAGVSARAPRVDAYVSEASPLPIYEWPAGTVAAVAVLVAGACVACGIAVERRFHPGGRHG